MKVGVMQPYFFPYIGYYQLMSTVDRFVLYDNVQFVKGGWVNRNRLLVNGRSTWFTLPLQKDSFQKLINERILSPTQWPSERKKLLTQIQQNYGNASEFKRVYPLIKKCICLEEPNLSRFIQYSICQVAEYLGLSVQIDLSSRINMDHDLQGQEKIISMCQELSADQYINLAGGRELYDIVSFKKSGIQLAFIQSKEIVYSQQSAEFIPSLSMIDMMMCNPVETIKEFLNSYVLT